MRDLSKLRAMSAAEILHRVRYQAVVERERRQHRGGPTRRHRIDCGARSCDLGAAADWHARLTAGRRSAPPSGFFRASASATPIRDLFRTRYMPNEAPRRPAMQPTRGQHRFAFFGREFDYGDEIAWQADPVTGTRGRPSITPTCRCTAATSATATSSTSGS